jgi:exoribonuclease II
MRHTDSRVSQKLSFTKEKNKIAEREVGDYINEGSKKTGEIKQENRGEEEIYKKERNEE